MDFAELERKKLTELRVTAREMGIAGFSGMKKQQLVYEIMRIEAANSGVEFRGGILEISHEEKQQIGFLRSGKDYSVSPTDVYVSNSQIRRLGLRNGDMIIGQVRVPKESEKYHSLVRVESVNGYDPDLAKTRPRFEDQTPIFPEQKLRLETESHIISTRLIDLIAPIGRGQRGLIVSPPNRVRRPC
jgi:transcription termination factor Rho